MDNYNNYGDRGYNNGDQGYNNGDKGYNNSDRGYNPQSGPAQSYTDSIPRSQDYYDRDGKESYDDNRSPCDDKYTIPPLTNTPLYPSYIPHPYTPVNPYTPAQQYTSNNTYFSELYSPLLQPPQSSFFNNQTFFWCSLSLCHKCIPFVPKHFASKCPPFTESTYSWPSICVYCSTRFPVHDAKICPNSNFLHPREMLSSARNAQLNRQFLNDKAKTLKPIGKQFITAKDGTQLGTIFIPEKAKLTYQRPNELKTLPPISVFLSNPQVQVPFKLSDHNISSPELGFKSKVGRKPVSYLNIPSPIKSFAKRGAQLIMSQSSAARYKIVGISTNKQTDLVGMSTNKQTDFVGMSTNKQTDFDDLESQIIGEDMQTKSPDTDTKYTISDISPYSKPYQILGRPVYSEYKKGVNTKKEKNRKKKESSTDKSGKRKKVKMSEEVQTAKCKTDEVEHKGSMKKVEDSIATTGQLLQDALLTPNQIHAKSKSGKRKYTVRKSKKMDKAVPDTETKQENVSIKSEQILSESQKQPGDKRKSTPKEKSDVCVSPTDASRGSYGSSTTPTKASGVDPVADSGAPGAESTPDSGTRLTRRCKKPKVLDL